MKMLTATLASLLIAPALAAGQPSPFAPDFSSNRPVAVDRNFAASDGTASIEPSTLVSFALDSVRLDAAALSQLDAVAIWLKEHPGENLVIQGHTDRVGPAAYNVDLARRRADRVRDHLMAWGIAEDRMVLAAYGARDSHRTVDEGDRRVEVFASSRPTRELASSLLASTRADQVAWSAGGAMIAEQRTR